MSDPVLEGALVDGRREALVLMRDTCTVERKSGQVFDEETGQYTDTWVEVYRGVCRIKPFGKAGQSPGRETEVGEREVTLHQYVLALPWDTTPAIQREDRVTVTTSEDTWVIGRPLEVIDVTYSGTATARRLVVEDNST